MRVYKKDDKYYCIGYEQYPMNPREWDNLGHMITYNRGYSPDPYDFDFIDKVKELYGDTHIDKDTDKVRVHGENYVVLPIYIYEHSCVLYSTNSFLGRAPHAEWDSGIAGIIYASGDEIKKFYGCKNLTKRVVDDVKRRFECECEDYTAYANGETFEYSVYSFKDGVFEHVETCGGYSDEDVIINELDLYDCEHEDFMDIKSLELELYRRANANKLGGI